ncbi:MAG: hypothetical protein ACREDP_23535, partial [Bradyrhizobium sp.]
MRDGEPSSATIWAMAALGAIALSFAIAFVAGFLLGHFTGDTTTTTVAASEGSAGQTKVAPGGAEAETAQGAAEEGASEPGAYVFIATG